MTEAETMSDKNLIAALCREVLDTFLDQRKDRSRFLELRAELESRLAAARPAGDQVTINLDTARDVIARRLEIEYDESETTADVVAYRILQDLTTPAPGGPEEV